MKSAGVLPFPLQLYDMLEDAERCGFDHIIAWIPNGAGFRVHKPDDLVEKILPRYLNQQTKYKSFQRQLNMYEFKMLRKVPKGSNKEMYKGAFFHPMFIRGKREISNMILRKSIIVHINTTPAPTKKRRAANRSTTTKTVGGSGEKEEDKKSPPSTQQLSYSYSNKENGITSFSTSTSSDERVTEKTTFAVLSSTSSSSSQHGVVDTGMKAPSVANSYESSTPTTNSPTCSREVKKTVSSTTSTKKNCEKKKTEKITVVPTSSNTIPGVAATPPSITTATKKTVCENDAFVPPSASIQFGGTPDEAARDHSVGTGFSSLGARSDSNIYYCTGYHLYSSSTCPPQHQDIDRRATITRNRISNFGAGYQGNHHFGTVRPPLDREIIACSNSMMTQEPTYQHGTNPPYPPTILKFPLSSHDKNVPFNNDTQEEAPRAHPAASRHDTQMETQQEPNHQYTPESKILLTEPSQHTKIYPEKHQQYVSTSSAFTGGDSHHVSSALVSFPPQSISPLSSTTRAPSSSSSLSSYISSSSPASNPSYSELYYFSKSSLIRGHGHQGEDESGRLEGFTSKTDANMMFHPVPANCMEPPHIGTTTTALFTETTVTKTHKDYEDEDPASWEELFLFGFDGSTYDDVPYNIMHPIEDDDITMGIISAFEINNNVQ